MRVKVETKKSHHFEDKDFLREMAILYSRTRPGRQLSHFLGALDGILKEEKLTDISYFPFEVKSYPQYKVLPILVKFTASYSQLGNLIRKLETQSIFLSITRVKILPKGTSDLEVEFIVNAYSLNKKFSFPKVSLKKTDQKLFLKSPFNILKPFQKAPLQSSLRLTTIAWSPERPLATVEYQGRSYVVEVGDIIGDEKIIDIQKSSITVLKKGAKIKLKVWPR
jgi:hypothetical protein